MKSYFPGHFFRYVFLLLLVFTLQIGADPSTNFNEPKIRLQGHVIKKALKDAVLLKSLDDSTEVFLTFTLPLRNQDKLEKLLQRLYDPADKEFYGKYLTADEFAEQFSPTQENYDYVIDYARSLGLSVTGTHHNRTLLNVSGPAISIEKGFNLSLNQYMAPTGRKFHAPTDNPEVPISIASVIDGVVGLDDSAVWRTYNLKKETTDEFLSKTPTPKSPSGPYGGFSPNDLVTAYSLTDVPTDGSGQIIALFQLGGYQLSDINQYTSYFGLPTPKLKNIIVDGGSGNPVEPEVTLDIELALALAPQSTIYVYEGPNTNQGVLNTYNRIATDNIAKQVSTSWGLGENLVGTQYLNAENAIFQQMAAHGQTIYAAAGDSGAYDNYDGNASRALAVDDPASQPYMTGVGGTKLTVNKQTGAYLSESVWNNGLGNGAGGGGVSGYWPIPTWQKNVPNTFSKTYRNVPDVALNADTNTGYAIFHDGQWVVYGGTSCAAPLWAAFTARVNQGRLAAQTAPLGFANPTLYTIGTGSTYASNFHDILNGNNLYYSAGNGYDNATGFGSFVGANLYTSLTKTSDVPTPPIQPPVLTPNLNISMTHTATFNKGSTGTYTITVSNNGKGPTTGEVKVAITLPKGLTLQSLSGPGWTFYRNTLTCYQSNPLKAGASYPPIVLKVNVSRTTASSVTSSSTVSGGGSQTRSVSDITKVK